MLTKALYFLYFTFFFALKTHAQKRSLDIPIDYHLANTNDPKHLALKRVPRDKNIFIFAKISAYEPAYFYEDKLRGKGYLEPIINAAILGLKSNKIPIYVDYFTGSKVLFYRKTPGYAYCLNSVDSLNQYKNQLKDLRKNGYKDKNNKFKLISKIIYVNNPIGMLGLSKNKRKLFNKHFWKNSKVYNILSILDDPQLYTTQIIYIRTITYPFIYNTDGIIKEKYKSRVYEFVASNSYQTPLMLKGNRMDYADLTIAGGDFYLKKLMISEEYVKVVPATPIHPDAISLNDFIVGTITCGGYDLNQLKKMINIINPIIEKLRTNFYFWEKVLKQFSLDAEIPYQSPEHFGPIKYNFKLKSKIDSGEFDEIFLD